MSDDFRRIEVITGAARRRRWTIEEKLRIVEETLRSGESIRSSRACNCSPRTMPTLIMLEW